MTINRRVFARGLALGCGLPWLAGFAPFEKLFAPASVKWDLWVPNDPASTRRIDHSVWDSFVKSQVHTGEDGVNRIHYGGVSAERRAALNDYVEGLATARVATLSRTEQFAFWVNLYNATVVRAILEHGPVNSILDIELGGGVFEDGPWETPLAEVDGHFLSLNDIEHRILRPIWEDPRIHYALNCAAVGCPNLRRVAFRADNSEDLLDSGAKDFAGHPRGVRLGDEGVAASKIFLWFQEDFGEDDLSVLVHLAKYAGPAKSPRLLEATGISHYFYDWSLNGSF